MVRGRLWLGSRRSRAIEGSVRHISVIDRYLCEAIKVYFCSMKIYDLLEENALPSSVHSSSLHFLHGSLGYIEISRNTIEYASYISTFTYKYWKGIKLYKILKYRDTVLINSFMNILGTANLTWQYEYAPWNSIPHEIPNLVMLTKNCRTCRIAQNAPRSTLSAWFRTKYECIEISVKL